MKKAICILPLLALSVAFAVGACFYISALKEFFIGLCTRRGYIMVLKYICKILQDIFTTAEEPTRSSGTTIDPYLVYSAEELRYCIENRTSFYLLKDMDLGGYWGYMDSGIRTTISFSKTHRFKPNFEWLSYTDYSSFV